MSAYSKSIHVGLKLWGFLMVLSVHNMNKRRKIKSLKLENKWIKKQNKELIKEIFRDGKKQNDKA